MCVRESVCARERAWKGPDSKILRHSTRVRVIMGTCVIKYFFFAVVYMKRMSYGEEDTCVFKYIFFVVVYVHVCVCVCVCVFVCVCVNS